jgi:hypothetical protein
MLEQDVNTPLNVIANTSRFNITASRSNTMEAGNNDPIVVSIGKLLTVMGQQDNTIKTLSKILGYDYNDRQIHNMHNSLFGGISRGFVTGSEAEKEGEDINYGGLLTQITAYIQLQNQQIQKLVASNMKNEQKIAYPIQNCR